MNQHQEEEGPEAQIDSHAANVRRPTLLDEEQPQDRQPADELTERQEALGCEVAIDELRADEHGDQGRQVEGPKDHRLLPGVVEIETRQVTEVQLEPRPPDKELKKHHDRQPNPWAVSGNAGGCRIGSTIEHDGLPGTTSAGGL